MNATLIKARELEAGNRVFLDGEWMYLNVVILRRDKVFLAVEYGLIKFDQFIILDGDQNVYVLNNSLDGQYTGGKQSA